jgi:hypothetical protein
VISGVHPVTAELTTGSVTTVDGLAEIKLTYPANSGTIHAGCLGVGVDTRFLPIDSAQTFTVATSTSGDAAMINDGGFCFASIAPWSVLAFPTDISGDDTITVEVLDGGDGIWLPFVPVAATVKITTGDALTVTAAPGTTDIGGAFTSTISVTGAQQGDTATITYWANASASVDVTLTVAGSVDPWILTAVPDTIVAAGTTDVLLTLFDGDATTTLVAAITQETTIINDTLTPLVIDVGEGTTDINGEFHSIIIVADGADPGDQAKVIFTAGTTTVTVYITIPP